MLPETGGFGEKYAARNIFGILEFDGQEMWTFRVKILKLNQ